MAILKVVFDEVAGLIKVSDLDPSFSSTEGLLKIIDPQGVNIYENGGYAASNFAAPDLNSGSPLFSIDIPLLGGKSLEGEYVLNYKTRPVGGGDLTEIRKVAFWKPDRPKICIEHVTNCLCSKITYSDATQYGSGFSINSRSWKANQPAAAAETEVVGSNKELTVGPNIWTGPHEAELVVSASIDHGDNVSSILELSGFLAVTVSCDSKKQIYNLLAATKDKYETLAITDPGQAAVGYREKIQLATVYAQLAEMAFDLGEWNAYEKAIESLKKIAPDCGCDDCADCGDEFPSEIEPLCAGGSSGGLNTEEVQDLIAAFLQEGDNIQITYNDPANTLTISAIIDTPAGVNSSYFRWNSTTGKWEAGGGNGVFVRLLDGQSYTVVPTTVDPVIYAAESSSITFPDPATVDSRFLVTVVMENTDPSEPPESSVCSIVIPDGKYATIDDDSIGRPESKFSNGPSGFKVYNLSNGKAMSWGVVTVAGNAKKWAPIYETSRFVNDPKIPNLGATGQYRGYGLSWDQTITDEDGFAGAYKADMLGRGIARTSVTTGPVSLGITTLGQNIVFATENVTLELPSVATALAEGMEVVIVHENSLANQPYGTSEIQITCGDTILGDPVDRFAFIGDTSSSGIYNMGVEPSRLSLNANVHSLRLRNGEMIRLAPSSTGNRWVGVIVSRFGASSGGSASLSWGDILGNLEDQTDIWDALGLKLDKTDYTASDVASKYATVVPKVSGAEITAGSGTVLRTYSVADIVALIAAHAPETTGFVDMYDTRGDLTTAYATPPAADSWAIIKENVELAVADSGAWKFQYIDGYSLDSATVTQLENDGNFTSGVYSGSTILAADLVAGKMHTKTGSNNIIYMCVNAASPYWVRIDVSGGGGGGATNLSYSASPTQGQVNSDTGSDAVLPLSDGTNAGLMSPAQHAKVAASITELADDPDPTLTADLTTAGNTIKSSGDWLYLKADDGYSAQLELGGDAGSTSFFITNNIGDTKFIVRDNGDMIITGDVLVVAGKTFDGRDVSVDGAKLDTIIPPESVDATAGDVGAIKLNSAYVTNQYGHTNPHTLSTLTVDATGLAVHGSAEIRVEGATRPTMAITSGTPAYQFVGDWSGWSATDPNRMLVTCRRLTPSVVIDIWYLGAEA